MAYYAHRRQQQQQQLYSLYKNTKGGWFAPPNTWKASRGGARQVHE